MAGSPFYNDPDNFPSTRIVSVENDGNWGPGNTYQVVVRSYFVYKSSDTYFEYWQCGLAPLLDGGRSDWIEEIGAAFNDGETDSYDVMPTPRSQGDPEFVDPTSFIEGDITWIETDQTEIYGDDPALPPIEEDYCTEFTYDVTVPVDITPGTYKLLFVNSYFRFSYGQDLVESASLLDTETFEVTISAFAPSSLFWPEDRPASYDPDLVWGWNGSEYAWLTGGGRYKNRLIAVGFDSNGIGIIYFGDV